MTLRRFEKYIYAWIALCGVAGLFFGRFFPQFIRDLSSLNIGGVSILIAVLMFFLMYSTMAKVKLEELSHAVNNVSPTLTTLIANWIIAPPLMVLLATLFLRNPDFRAGAILLGISPCTGMVLFWIAFARGNVTQGIVITAINAVSTLLLYTPFASFYLGVGGVPVPFSLVALSVLLFVALPLIVGQVSKRLLTWYKGEHWFTNRFLPMMNTLAAAALLGMLMLLFSSGGQMILEYPLIVALIAIPVLLHFVLMLAGTYLVSWLFRYRYEDAAMTALISSSTQFEIAIGTANIFRQTPEVTYFHPEADWGGLLSTEDYYTIGKLVKEFSERICHGKRYGVLKGGYNHLETKYQISTPQLGEIVIVNSA